MCEFVSTVEVNGKQYFLTGNQVFHTKKGKALRDYCGSTDDYTGHGAIRRYYGIPEHAGTNHEYTDFTSPADFPPEVAEAIKSGAMRGLAIVPDLLMPSLLPELDKAWAAYGKARAEYTKALAASDDEYTKALAASDDEYTKALAAYGKAQAAITQKRFWDLFAVPENRIEAWR